VLIFSRSMTTRLVQSVKLQPLSRKVENTIHARSISAGSTYSIWHAAAEIKGAPTAKAMSALFEQGQELIQDVVGCEQAVGRVGEPGQGRGVVDIVRDVPCVPGSGIDEDHLGCP
jgi:hypothetical protein